MSGSHAGPPVQRVGAAPHGRPAAVAVGGRSGWGGAAATWADRGRPRRAAPTPRACGAARKTSGSGG